MEAEGWKKPKDADIKTQWWGRVQSTVWHCRATSKMCELSIISSSPNTSNVFHYLHTSYQVEFTTPKIDTMSTSKFSYSTLSIYPRSPYIGCSYSFCKSYPSSKIQGPLALNPQNFWTWEKVRLRAKDHCKIQGANLHISASPPNMFIKLIYVFFCFPAHFSPVWLITVWRA